MTSQRDLWKVTILTNVPYLAKMANMAKFRQPLNYVPNKIAKRPLGRWRIWRNSPKMWLNFLWDVQRGPFNSGDFDENGKHGDVTKIANSSFSPNLPFFVKITTFQEAALDITFQFSPNLSFFPFCLFRHSSLFKGHLRTSLNFRQIFDEVSPDLSFSLLHAFLVIRKVSRVIIIEGDWAPFWERN